MILFVDYKGLLQFCFVIIPIIQVFFLYFGTVTTEVSLRLSVLWDFSTLGHLG